MGYDIDKLGEQLGGLVEITVPENGDLDELSIALTDLSRKGIELTKKLLRGKAIETKLRMSMMQMKSEQKAKRSRIIDSDEKFAECKNDKSREAYIEVALAEEVADYERAEIQHVNVKLVVELVSDALSCLKSLKGNVSGQIQIREIEAGLEPKE